MITQSIKIYRVDKGNYRFKDCGSNIHILKRITTLLNGKRGNSEIINFEQLSTFEENDLKFYLYVDKHKEKNSDWEKYFPFMLTTSWDFRLQNLSIVLFIDNGIDIFIIIGGSAFHQIVTFIDHSFGLRVLSKIIKPSEDQILSINTRGLTGSRSGLSEQYREQIRVADFAKFGKLPTEVHLTLSSNISDEFFSFLKDKSSDRIRIHVGKSFKVKKNLTFEELKNLVITLGYIMELEEQEYLSSYIQESNSTIIIESFQPLLIAKIFEDFGNKKIERSNYKQKFKFDFCNSNDIIKFYSADRYILTEKEGKTYIQFDETNNKDQIYDKVLERCIQKFPEQTELFDFRADIQGIRVIAYQDGKKACSGSFLYHFTSEFMFGNQAIFLVDNKWYRLKSSFIEELKEEAQSLFKRNKLPNGIFDLTYKHASSEGEYNLQYHGSERYMVFDTITPQGIELCDVLYISEDAIYLIHVKKGFNNSIRELTNQILVSARRLYTDLKSSKKEYLEKVWEAYSYKYPNDRRFTFNTFLQFFEKKIIFTLAFVSQRSDNANIIIDIDKYRSNIAKYSMIECSRDMQDYRFELNIHQIPR